MPRGKRRGGGNASVYPSTNSRPVLDGPSQLSKSFSHVEQRSQDVFCNLCPQGRPPMTSQTLARAAYCTGCNAAYNPGCVKRCTVYEDGTFDECCGQQFQH